MIVCFDIGGVLVRICRTWEEGCIAADVSLRPFQEKPDHVERRQTLLANLQRGDIEDGDFHQRLSDLFEGMWSREEVARVDTAWLLDAYPGTLEVIRELDANGVQTACLSNTSQGHWDCLLAHENVASLGSHHASHLLGLAKPDPEIYAEFERLVGARPEEIVFFDDLEANVESAAARGWDAVRIDHEADTAKQMLDALRIRGLL